MHNTDYMDLFGGIKFEGSIGGRVISDPREMLHQAALKLPVNICDLDHPPACDAARRLPTARILHQGKGIYFGDGHGLIIPFLNDAISREILRLPCSFINFDFHADIAPYTDQTHSHTASWQRFICDIGLCYSAENINIRPAHSTAVPVSSFNPEKFIKEVGLHLSTNQSAKVLSVDLDFFNHLKPDDIIFKDALSALQTLAPEADAVMIFSSSGWTISSSREPIAYQSSQQLSDLARRIYEFAVS